MLADAGCCGLPQAAPVLPLQVMDFNGDRLNDVVLVARDGIYAWAQARPAPYSRTSSHIPCMHVDAPGRPHLVLR